MTISGDGGELVSAPRCDPRPGGLLSVAELDERSDNLWFKGLEFESELCTTGGPRVVSMQCPPPVEQLKEARRGFDTEYSDPFVVYAGYDCATFGTPLSEAWDHAEVSLERGWRWALERALWTGQDQDGNSFRMSLEGGGAEDLTPGGGAVGVVAGVSLLEGYMANFMCLPVIHGPLAASAFLAEKAQLRHEGGKTTTAAGTPVALGAGYPGTGPSGAAPGTDETWLFASGGVRITTGPKFFAPAKGDEAGAVDRAVNDVTVFAEKGFAVQLGCGLAAVRVTFAP